MSESNKQSLRKRIAPWVYGSGMVIEAVFVLMYAFLIIRGQWAWLPAVFLYAWITWKFYGWWKDSRHVTK